MTAVTTAPAATRPQAPAAPALLELEITGKCQLNCRHCYADSGPRGGHGTMTAADWEHVIDQAAAIGVKTVQFIGGEPVLAPMLPRLISHALAAGLSVSIFSNLARVTPELFGMFSGPRVSLSTSWYTADPAVHAQITGSKTAWASTRANIREAVSRGIDVQVKIVDGIVPGQDAAAAEADLRELGVTSIAVRPSQGIGRAARQENDPSELCGHCGIGRAAVLPDGQFTLCVMARWMKTGDVRQTSVREILAGSAWAGAMALVPRRGRDCPPASDGGDCPPASEVPCAPESN